MGTTRRKSHVRRTKAGKVEQVREHQLHFLGKNQKMSNDEVRGMKRLVAGQWRLLQMAFRRLITAKTKEERADAQRVHRDMYKVWQTMKMVQDSVLGELRKKSTKKVQNIKDTEQAYKMGKDAEKSGASFGDNPWGVDVTNGKNDELYLSWASGWDDSFYAKANKYR